MRRNPERFDDFLSFTIFVTILLDGSRISGKMKKIFKEHYRRAKKKFDKINSQVIRFKIFYRALFWKGRYQV